MNKREIPEDEFSKIAETASQCDCLKGREGEFGTIFGIFLNGHLVMSSEILKDGERHYYSHLD
jgi:hypothetical protein